MLHHLSFAVSDLARSAASVAAFHAAALSQGGRDDGAPGLRPAYGAHYFAAFVVDPDGYRIEAVINRPSPRPFPKGEGGGQS